MDSSTETQFKPSIRKQFLTKIYQRNSISQRNVESSEEKSENPSSVPSCSFMTELSEPHIENPEQTPQTVKKVHYRSATPKINTIKRSKSPSRRVVSMDIFHDFLQDLLHSTGNISSDTLKKIPKITKSLNDNFARNPEFSLQFYISMIGILNLLNEPQHIIFSNLQAKVEEAISLTYQGSNEVEQLTLLKKHISKINVKIVNVSYK